MRPKYPTGIQARPSFRRSERVVVNAKAQMTPILTIKNLTKTYTTGLKALRGIDLEIHEGEIFALLGPNGAGKTTLISIVCGIVTPSSGRVTAGGHDIV